MGGKVGIILFPPILALRADEEVSASAAPKPSGNGSLESF